MVTPQVAFARTVIDGVRRRKPDDEDWVVLHTELSSNKIDPGSARRLLQDAIEKHPHDPIATCSPVAALQPAE